MRDFGMRHARMLCVPSGSDQSVANILNKLSDVNAEVYIVIIILIVIITRQRAICISFKLFICADGLPWWSPSHVLVIKSNFYLH